MLVTQRGGERRRRERKTERELQIRRHAHPRTPRLYLFHLFSLSIFFQFIKVRFQRGDRKSIPSSGPFLDRHWGMSHTGVMREQWKGVRLEGACITSKWMINLQNRPTFVCGAFLQSITFKVLKIVRKTQ